MARHLCACNTLRSQLGLTLIELIIVLTLSAILLGIAMPSLQPLLSRQTRSSSVNQVIAILRYTQQKAVFSGRPATLCPSSSGDSCDAAWGSGQLMVFADPEGDGLFDKDGADQLLKLVLLPNDWSINWRAFGNRNYIAYDPRGYVFNQNGTMEICPAQATDVIAVLVINRIGRLRREERRYSASKC